MSSFKPTFLYIKRHSITGLMYFGKTTKTNPLVYNGSGKYWTHHIEKHGKQHIETLWYCLYTDIETLQEAALSLSNSLEVALSESWANLKPENGLDGGSFVGYNGFKGKKHSVEHIEKLRAQGKTRPVTENMRKSYLKRNVSGSNNGRAITIHIFDSDGVLRFVCNGNFEKTCEENNLPIGPLKLSYLNNGKSLFTSKSPGRLKDLSMLRYKGWFAKIIN